MSLHRDLALPPSSALAFVVDERTNMVVVAL